MSRPSLRAIALTVLLGIQVVAPFGAAGHDVASSLNGPDLRLASIDVVAGPGSDNTRKWFVSTGDTVNLVLKLGNDGNAEFSGTVAIDLRELAAATPIPGGCILKALTVPAGAGTGANPLVDAPLSFVVPSVTGGSDAWNLRIMVNANNTAATNWGRAQTPACAPSSGDGAQKDELSVPPTQAHPFEDNFGLVTFAVNRKPDLRIDIKATPQATIRWCAGEAVAATCAQTVGDGGGDAVVNDTKYASTKTYFAITLKNGEPNAAGQYPGVYRGGETNLVLPGKDPSVTANRLPVELRIRATEVASPDAITNLDSVITSWATDVGSCGPIANNVCPQFNLLRRAGNFTITVEVDPDNKLPDKSGTPENRSTSRRVEVKGVELRATYDIVGEPILETTGTLWFNVTIKNVGKVAASGQGDVRWETFLLNPKSGEPQRPIGGGTIPQPFAPGASSVKEIKYDYVANSGLGNFVRGGRIEILTILDLASTTDTTDGNYPEQCESSLTDTVGCAGLTNKALAAVRIKDAQRPAVVKWGFSTGSAPPYTIDASDPAPDITKKEPFQITVVLTDNDEALDTATGIVRVNFTVNGVTTSHTFPDAENPGRRGTGTDTNFYFTRAFPGGLATLGSYTVTVDAKDSFGNRPLTGEATRTFLVKAWPIQGVTVETEACRPIEVEAPGDPRKPCDGSGVWRETPRKFDVVEQTYSWRLKVTAAQTGVPDARVESVPVAKKFITITKPDGTQLRRALLTSSSSCSARAPPTPPATQGPCTTWQNTDLYHHTELGTVTTLGVWRSLVEIEDKAGDVRKLYWNFTIRDQIPEVALVNPVTTVDARSDMTLNFDILDDVAPVAKTFANFTHTNATGVKTYRNFSLTPTGACAQGSDSRYKCSFIRTITTGWLSGERELARAGDWSYRITTLEGGGAQLWHTWPTTDVAARKVTVVDKLTPSITVARASAVEEEAGFPVTWNVTAGDDTRFEAYLTLVHANTSAFVPNFRWVKLTGPSPQGEFSYTSPLPLGNYTWRITVVDSDGKAPPSTTPVALAILPNTLPRISVVAPGPSLEVTPAGCGSDSCKFFRAPPRPTVTVLIYDNDGVSKQSIRFLVKLGVQNTYADVTSSTTISGSVQPLGWYVTYLHTINEDNGTRLDIRVRAHDNSSLINQTRDIAIVTDGTAPTSKLLDDDAHISLPKYRTSSQHLYNVTRATLFKVSSSDPGGAGVDEIRYSIDSIEGPYTTMEATGFRLTTDHGRHVIWFRAIDRVGNMEAPKNKTVFVDIEAPTILRSEPTYKVDEQGVRFTITDSGTGVMRASAFYRVGSNEWTELVLTYNASLNMYAGSFPPFQHGQRVQIYVTAKDWFSNEVSWGSQAAPANGFTVGNRKPIVTILEPANDSTVSGTIKIAWDVRDPDPADTVTVTLFYRPEAELAWRKIGDVFREKKGSFDLDTTTLLDGRYVIDVEARDHELPGNKSVTITILNARQPIEKIGLPSTTPTIGQSVLIQAQVTKKDVVSVIATIARGGAAVASVDLNDAGQNGDLIAGDFTFGAVYTPPEPGKFDVEVTVKYREGGQVQEFKKRTSFDVQATSVWVVTSNPLLWGAIGAFGIGVVALGAWGLTRRWS